MCTSLLRDNHTAYLPSRTANSLIVIGLWPGCVQAVQPAHSIAAA